MRKLAVVCGLLSLAACAEPVTYRPYVDLPGSGKTQAQYEADVKACQGRTHSPGSFTRESGDSMAYGLGGDYYTMVGDMQDCMSARGYKVLG
jgi:hypothetical protein